MKTTISGQTALGGWSSGLLMVVPLLLVLSTAMGLLAAQVGRVAAQEGLVPEAAVAEGMPAPEEVTAPEAAAADVPAPEEAAVAEGMPAPEEVTAPEEMVPPGEPADELNPVPPTAAQPSTGQLGTAPTGAAPGSVDLNRIFPAGPGRALVLQNCTTCHNIVPIVIAQKTKDEWLGWRPTHRPRVGGLSDADFQILLNYLGEHFNPDSPVPDLPPALLATWTDY